MQQVSLRLHLHLHMHLQLPPATPGLHTDILPSSTTCMEDDESCVPVWARELMRGHLIRGRFIKFQGQRYLKRPLPSA